MLRLIPGLVGLAIFAALAFIAEAKAASGQLPAGETVGIMVPGDRVIFLVQPVSGLCAYGYFAYEVRDSTNVPLHAEPHAIMMEGTQRVFEPENVAIGGGTITLECLNGHIWYFAPDYTHLK